MILRKLRMNPKEWLKGVFPILKWLSSYKISYLPYDLIAGITIALTLIPSSMAFAQMASLKTEHGLYSCLLGQFVYVFLGTSSESVVAPSAIGAMLTGQYNAHNLLASEGDSTYAVILTFVSGIVLMLIGFLKLSFIANLFSIPVVSGFTSAACFAIMASQLKAFFGLKSAPNETPGVFVRQIKNVYDNWSEIHYVDLYFGIASVIFLVLVAYSQRIILLLVSRCQEPKTQAKRRFKAIAIEALRIFVSSRNIILFVTSTGIAYHLVSRNPEIKQQLSLVGKIKKGLPVPRFPNFALYNSTAGTNETSILQTSQEVIMNLGVGFIIMPLITAMELFAILKSLASKGGYRLDATNEFIAFGLGNFLGSFIQALPVTAPAGIVALNSQCRVKSNLGAIVSIIVIIIAIEELTEVFYYVPKTVLASIIIVAAHYLFDYETIIRMYREYKLDLIMFSVTFLLCLFFDLAYGILIAILLNMFTFIKPAVQLDIAVTKEVVCSGADGQVAYAKVIQLSHGMKYPSADKFLDRMALILASDERHYVIDCRFINGIDFSGLQAWRVFLQMVYRKKKHVIFTNLHGSVLVHLEAAGLENFRYVDEIEAAIRGHRLISSPVEDKLADVSSLDPMISTVPSNMSQLAEDEFEESEAQTADATHCPRPWDAVASSDDNDHYSVPMSTFKIEIIADSLN